MSIEESLVKVKIHPRNYKYYHNKFETEQGYYIVPVQFLDKNCKVKVTKKCDICGFKNIVEFRSIFIYRVDNKDYCWKCANTRAQINAKLKGTKKGFKWSEESKIKARNSHLGKKHSENTKEKIRKSVSFTTNSKEWKEWIKKYNFENKSLESYQRRFGEEGLEKYKIERLSKSIFSIEYWIKKFDGDKYKAKEALSNFQRRDFYYFISKYGEELGTERYFDSIKNRNFGSFSKISQKFIYEVIDELELSKENLCFGNNEMMIRLSEDERQEINNQRKCLFLDFYDIKENIAIEFDGDYWHSLEEQIKLDDFRNKVLSNRNINLIRVKESDYMTDKEKTINMIRRFYEDCKNRK